MTPLARGLQRLSSRQDLTREETAAAVGTIMDGEAPEAQIAAFLAALRIKGETADELAGAVSAVRGRMTTFEGDFPPLLDTCGTGGDGAGTLNISTVTALLTAACGVPVAKHGNRSASGSTGSAEVLSELGIEIEPEPGLLARCLVELGVTFLYAPRFHPALRHAASARRLLPFRTLFNLVGPLANPARPAYQLVGVADERHADLIAQTLAGLGVRRAAVVTGAGHLDEVSLAGPTRVLWVEADQIAHENWFPHDFGLPPGHVADLAVSGPVESASCIRRLLDGERGPVRDVVLANTAAALRVVGRVADLSEGVQLAAEALDRGEARELLERWRTLSRSGARTT